ncbi:MULTISPECIES: Hsp70 family protein [Flavobacteriales]|uniref:Hsp70 family protein n=1 Tax=Chryseobacterium piscium TaxID=333702 RepID=A0A3D9BL84_9FLAO|nr:MULTISPECIES: Hsp70 family protein [Flavobacteriales]REC54172.1 Hsp70 family protein [Chryseobacterium piscium]
MARLKIDFGIDLGTTNSAIAVIDNGKPKMFRTDTQRDTLPSCVLVTHKSRLIGDKAYGQLPKDRKKAFNESDFTSNIFIEFKRTMGNSEVYKTDKGIELSSEELSSEVLKTLKSFVDTENVKSAIITIPAAFEMNQINATKKAAELAGIEYVELVQEPYAAAIAYGVSSSNKNGYWLVFDFGGGTFDSALVKVSDGIIKVIDTEGDNFLGGKNLDEAIVNEIFIPYLKNKYTIDSILEVTARFNAFKEMWKPLAEDAKNQLSYKEEYSILTNLYDEYGEDDKGEEFEIELSITRAKLKEIISPFIQKAIDYCKTLLQRNNLDGGKLDELILVGGPTLSPIVREMIAEQIKTPNTSIDPMTVVAQGAAIYASSINNPVESDNNSIDNSVVQLKVDYESMVVGTETYVTLKLKENQKDKTVFIEISRTDEAFKSERVELNEIGEVIELQLVEGNNNGFEIIAYDEKGNRLDCEPKLFDIREGSVPGGAPLPHAICIEVMDKVTGKNIIKPLIGLEKNKTLPSFGIYNDLKTQKQIRPGMDDTIEIPIYQGEPNTKPVINNHVSTIKISGNDLPALLPEGSIMNLKIDIDRSNIMTGVASFIDIDFEFPFEVGSNESDVKPEWLERQIQEVKANYREVSDTIDENKRNEINDDLERVEKIFESKKTESGRLEARSELQKVAQTIDKLESEAEWPKLEEELKEEFYRLEKANKDLGNDRSTQVVNQLRNQLEEVLKSQDIKLGKTLAEEIHSVFFQMTLVYQLINFIRQHNQNFSQFHWTDSHRARQLLNEGLQQIGENPNTDDLHPIVIELINLLPVTERPSDYDGILVG